MILCSPKQTACTLAAILFCFTASLAAAPQPYTIYIDADNTHTKESTYAIELGIKTALYDNSDRLKDMAIDVKIIDHRGNSARSKANFKRISKDPQAIAVFSGMHSPPLIKNRSFNNSLGVPILVPWAAGGPITRNDDGNNVTFRLSIDDTNAGTKLAQYAVTTLGCKQPKLMLEDTGWGKSNQRSMTNALADLGIQQPSITWFGWDESEASLRVKLDQLALDSNSCALLVANASEGAKIVRTVHQINSDVPIVSHWGITGSNFGELLAPVSPDKNNLYVIQTCFAFTNSSLTPKQTAVTKSMMMVDPSITDAAQIKAPVGLIHAYDLTYLFIEALLSADQTKPITQLRQQIIAKLYDLPPYDGLVKEYRTPFSRYTSDNINGHEALSTSDYCMAQYQNGAIKLTEKQ